ncbi:MAG: hypothetical protein AB1757_00435 [Acidobacteriota bacterium]
MRATFGRVQKSAREFFTFVCGQRFTDVFLNQIVFGEFHFVKKFFIGEQALLDPFALVFR